MIQMTMVSAVETRWSGKRSQFTAGSTRIPTTRAVAVPIYQTVAYAFDSAEHGAALFNLEVPGYRYTRIGNPTTDILEERVAALKGRRRAQRRFRPGRALLRGARRCRARQQHRLGAAALRHDVHAVRAPTAEARRQARFAKSDRAEDLEALIDANTRALFCETVGNPAGNVCDLEALAGVAHRHGMPLIVDNTVPTPMLVRPMEYGADIIVHSLTKFMGGHGTTLGGIVVDCGSFPWDEHAARYPMFSEPDESYHGFVYTRALRCRGLHRALPQRLSTHHGSGAIADERVSTAAGDRDGGAARRAARGERAPESRSFCAAIRA